MELADRTRVTLTGQNFHRICRVLRQKKGEKLLIFNQNEERLATIAAIGSNEVELQLLHQTKTAAFQASSLSVDLYFNSIKHVNTAFIVEKATELGVRSIQPLAADKCIVRTFNRQKCHFAAIAATEQSGRLTPADLATTATTVSRGLAQAIANSTTILVFDLQEYWPKDKICSSLSFCNELSSSAYSLFFGPEGGWSDRERQEFCQLPNLYVCSLGDLVLRAETAIIAGLATVNHYLQANSKAV